MSLKIWTLTVMNPADNAAAGDYNEMMVAAETIEDARGWAWRHAVRAGNHNESIWLHGNEFDLRVLLFDETPDNPQSGVQSASIWTVECKFCGANLHHETGLWVDALSGDWGGTYDYCPENGGGHRPAEGHIVDEAATV